ncbi:RDD family protein [Agromyces aurantiacus]|uniref:RDD family protein n=1 Tax=Agromyces aurantiacus TaxID=165814 RepID=A0ABV9R7H1_9MICO|nr:RDD family protein [Agromyces aurantiacus]MBM7504193.1 putative RDD family membrane protein YckC [Agromyces aurantiacus]
MADASASAPPAGRVDDESLVTGEAVALDIRPASAVMRAGGAAIDVAATVVLGVGVFLAVAGLDLDEAALRAVGISLVVGCIVVLPTAVETASRGRSLGKLAMGLRVVRDDGGAIGVRHAFIRALTGVLEIWMTFGGLAVLVGFLNPDSKRLGDLLAGTHAQVERVPRYAPQTFGVPAPLAAWATIADVGRLPDPVARRVAAFFRNAPHLAPASRRRVAERLVAEVAPYVSPVPAGDPELLLAGVAAMRRDRDLTSLALQERRMRALEPVLDARPNGFPDR